MADDRLHQLRQKTAARLAALYERHNREADQVVEEYEQTLKELGLDGAQRAAETMAMIREATPVLAEYDLTGLDNVEDDVAST